MTITKNHLANHWRDRKETISLDLIESGNNVDDTDNLTHPSLFAKAMEYFNTWQDKGELASLLDKLNEQDKEIVTLHYLCGYKYTEIAKIQNMKVSAVKVKAHRAIKKLRELK